MAESKKQGKKGAKSSSPGRQRYFARRLLVKRAEINKAKRIARHAKTLGTKHPGPSIKHPYLSARKIIDWNKKRVPPTISDGIVHSTAKDPETRRITMRPVTNACADYIARSQPGGAIIHRLTGDVAHVYCRA